MKLKNPFYVDTYAQLNRQLDSMIAEARKRPMAERVPMTADGKPRLPPFCQPILQFGEMPFWVGQFARWTPVLVLAAFILVLVFR
jgi:hypothetical protein